MECDEWFFWGIIRSVWAMMNERERFICATGKK